MRLICGIWIVLCVFVTACSSDSPESAPERVYPTDYINKEHLIEPDELANLSQGDTKFTIIDIRKEAQYLDGHIPGAVNVWRPQITSDSFPYSGMVADDVKISSLLASIGVYPAFKLVLYDGKGGSDAARMWWILEKYGHENTCILNGGYKRWTDLGYAIDTNMTVTDSLDYKLYQGSRDLAQSIDKERIKAVLHDTNYVILDVRTEDEFTGRRQKKNAFKGGRIPGAIRWEWGNAVHLDKDHSLKSPKDLLYELDSIGVTADKNIICYCHSGVRSAHTTFVLSELLGFPNVMNYDGSWTEWSYYDDLPFETDYESPEILK